MKTPEERADKLFDDLRAAWFSETALREWCELVTNQIREAAQAERERILGVIKSIPCAGCEIADGSHFSDCPQYTTEWVIQEIVDESQ